MKTKKILRITSGIILSTIVVLFVGSYFQLDLPLTALVDRLKSNFLIALAAGILSTLLIEWTIKRNESQ